MFSSSRSCLKLKKPCSLNRFAISLALISMLFILIGCGGGGTPTPPSTEIVFTINSTDTEHVFAPVITVTGTPEILWTFDDATTSSSATPTKDFGSAGTHTARLVVTPWSAVTRINIGYDAGDGGSGSIEHVPDQHVSSVQGLDCVAPNLKQWCSSYNTIPSLDFSNFVELDTIECFLSQSMTGVTLHNVPKLKRACFEDNNLSSLDLSDCPALEDLRGAVNNYPDINWGNIGSHVWHICIRDNPQLTNRNMFANADNKFPNLTELFIWDDNQTGALKISATHPTSGVAIMASTNQYTSLNLSGALQNETAYGQVDLSRNSLTSVNITGCKQIINLDLHHNLLDSAAVDGILAALVTLGRVHMSGDYDCSVDLSENSAPSPTGLSSKATLESRGWTVNVDP